MQNIRLNIDNSAVAKHTATLKKLHKSALPVAVRQSLSKAAFDVKGVTMPKEAKTFTQRNANFFKAKSKVEPAKGFNLSTMKATVGFIPGTGAAESGGATKDLEQQEQGGKIGHRSFIPLKTARAGGGWNRNVKAAMRMAAIKAKIVDSQDSGAKNSKGKFLRSAAHAGVGGFVIGNKVSQNGNKLLWIVKSVTKDGGNTKVKAIPVYSVRSHRNVQVRATKFMQKASTTSGLKIEQYFINEAEKQIAKYK